MKNTLLRDVLLISFPQIVCVFIAQFLSAINTSVIGHVGTADHVAGAGISVMTLQLTAFVVSLGLNNALNSMISQASGSGEYQICGLYLNRARVLVTAFFIMLSLLLQCLETLFH